MVGEEEGLGVEEGEETEEGKEEEEVEVDLGGEGISNGAEVGGMFLLGVVLVDWG